MMGVSWPSKPFRTNCFMYAHPAGETVSSSARLHCPYVHVNGSILRGAATPSFSIAQALGSEIETSMHAGCFSTVLFLKCTGARVKPAFKIIVLLVDWTVGGILVSTKFTKRAWNFHFLPGFLSWSICRRLALCKITH